MKFGYFRRNFGQVGENIEPDKGFWMARQIMYRGGNHPTPVNCASCKTDPRPRNCGGHAEPPPCCAAGAREPCDGKVLPTEDKDRGKDYNHSTFLDIIIAGLVGTHPGPRSNVAVAFALTVRCGAASAGLRAAFGNLLAIEPLADRSISYFALDNVAYHGHNISVAFDAAGKRYAKSGCNAVRTFACGPSLPVAAAADTLRLGRCCAPGWMASWLRTSRHWRG